VAYSCGGVWRRGTGHLSGARNTPTTSTP